MTIETEMMRENMLGVETFNNRAYPNVACFGDDDNMYVLTALEEKLFRIIKTIHAEMEGTLLDSARGHIENMVERLTGEDLDDVFVEDCADDWYVD